MRKLTLALVIAILAMAGFYGGFRVGESRAQASTGASPSPAALNPGARAAGGGAAALPGGAGAAGGQASPGGLPGGGAPGGRGGSAIQGTVTAVGNGTITVHDRTSNTDVKVSLGTGTVITKSQAGQQSDLQQNAVVTVQGQKAADGTVQAVSITIIPSGTGPDR